jgi:hypothetical protein
MLKVQRSLTEIEVNWRVTFIDYIHEHKLPPGVNPKGAEATRILRHSKRVRRRQIVQAWVWVNVRHTLEVCPHGGG